MSRDYVNKVGQRQEENACINYGDCACKTAGAPRPMGRSTAQSKASEWTPCYLPSKGVCYFNIDILLFKIAHNLCEVIGQRNDRSCCLLTGGRGRFQALKLWSDIARGASQISHGPLNAMNRRGVRDEEEKRGS